MAFGRHQFLVGLVAFGVTALCVGRSLAQSSLPKVVRIGYQVIPNAELLVKVKGLAKNAFGDGVEVQYVNFDSGRDVNTAIAAKSIDFGLVGSVPAAIGVARGLEYDVFFLHDIIGQAEALAVKSGISKPADLVGKRIAVPFGSTTHFSLLAYLDLEGVDASKVTILDLQPPDIVAAWQRGDIDGAYVWQPNLSRLLNDGGSVLTDSAVLAKRGALTADVGVVRREFAEQYPEALKRYVKALDQAVELYRANPEDAIASLSKELGLTPEETKEAASQLIWLTAKEQQAAAYLGQPGAQAGFAKVLEETAQFLVAQGIIPTAPSADTYQKHIRSQALQ
ncbi:MAG: ABC transporter substrate-binding protein [Synechococcales cyanobacterium]